MFVERFCKLLIECPGCIKDAKTFEAHMLDYFPTEKKMANVMIQLYKFGIVEKIKNTSQMDNAFVIRCKKGLMETYGTGSDDAAGAVAVWCRCYGRNILKKPCTFDLNVLRDADGSSLKNASGTLSSAGQAKTGRRKKKIWKPILITELLLFVILFAYIQIKGWLVKETDADKSNVLVQNEDNQEAEDEDRTAEELPEDDSTADMADTFVDTFTDVAADSIDSGQAGLQESGSSLDTDSQFENAVGSVTGNVASVQQEEKVNLANEERDAYINQLKEEQRIQDSMPKRIEDIPDINQNFLNQYENLVADKQDFYGVAQKEQESQKYKILTECPMGAFVKGASTAYYWEKTNGQTIYTVKGADCIKFAYYHLMRGKDVIVVAVDPSVISSKLSYDSSINELENLMGKGYNHDVSFLSEFATMEINKSIWSDEYPYVLYYLENDIVISFVMDKEKTKMIDYVYIYKDVGE